MGGDSNYYPKCKGHIARRFVKECLHKCGCNIRCGNRVVQRGIRARLEVSQVWLFGKLILCLEILDFTNSSLICDLVISLLHVFFTNDGRGCGLHTAEGLPAGLFVCEYVGEILTNTELDQQM